MGYYFDSYAIVEILKSNPNYAHFRNEAVVTAAPNLGETVYYGIRTGQLGQTKAGISKMKPELLNTSLRDWTEAAEFKYGHRKSNMSLIDALGYVLAKENNLKFLTGDPVFQNLPNVEFVK